MKLQELLKGVAVLSRTADGEAEIGEVRYDSRAVGKVELLGAIRCYATDGHKYIEKALEQGAAAVVCEEAPEGAPAVVVENSRKALAEIAANRYGHPADSMVMLGVTGTNGKPTTPYLVKHMLEDAGHKVGLIGTNQNLIGSEVIETERTTPESYELHALFARMRDAGCTHVIMEVSSHSLVLDRVHGIRFAVGAFTNLTQDHLDFHKTMENYRQAKAILFTVSDRGVINLDDAAADKMLADAKCPCLTYSCGNEKAGLCATNLQLHADGVEFDARYNGETAHVRLPIPGHFSVENALNALGMVLSLGMPLADAAKSMATATGVKGRVEVVPTDTDYTVLIDYAHTPDGLKNILSTVCGFADARVLVVFGCGGDRDRTKRAEMGRIAARLADEVIVTSDNPRPEDPYAILHEILAGMADSATSIAVLESRREAIAYALDHARTGDVVVLAGKGHETYQVVGAETLPLDERQVVREQLSQ